MDLRTCVIPPGCFRYGVHKPHYRVQNQRTNDFITPLGTEPDGEPCWNRANFPVSSVEVEQADTIYEIANPFPFRGTTYIAKSWADANAADPGRIRLPEAADVSFCRVIKQWREQGIMNEVPPEKIFASLPEQMMLSLAVTSTDPDDLVYLAHLCCEFEGKIEVGNPRGLRYQRTNDGRTKPHITNWAVFEALANNPSLPNPYKQVMVLKPGAQGGSEIVGEWRAPDGTSHVFEYLRRNSYIPWGHYAANMAHDAVRYRIQDLTPADITGMRHLYYQRTYIRMCEQLGLPSPVERKALSVSELETLRLSIQGALSAGKNTRAPALDATLWGWNFGFDFSPSRYRLHASHQQIHQQFAMVPRSVTMEKSTGASHETTDGGYLAFGGSDLLHDFIIAYRSQTHRSFFSDYFQAIRTNRRMDGREDRESGLIIHEDKNVLVFVPKAQTSQWEIQLVTSMPIGNILEADTVVRDSLDHAMFITMKILSRLGATMITTIEYASRFHAGNKDFHLLYAFLPKLPESPGAFSEAQLRWINGHYPEDFAEACRRSFRECF